jgi:hypothetical protein
MSEETIFIGSRERFGMCLRVFGEIRGGVFAEVLLWILGEPLGRKDDPVAVYSLVDALEGMAKSSNHDLVAEVMKLPAADTWARLEAEDSEYMMPPIDFFDDYDMYCVADEQAVRYLWKECSLRAGAPHDATLPRKEVDDVLRELRATYDALEAARRSHRP